MPSTDYTEAYPDRPDTVVCSECGDELNRCYICKRYIHRDEVVYCNRTDHICLGCKDQMVEDEKTDAYIEDKRLNKVD